MAVRQQQRRGTAAQWTSANPILSAAEIGYETDTNKFKIGDGTNRWATLNYFVDLNTTIAGAPGLLNSLDEIAAAIGDDPAFFTTVSTNLANHQADTTNIHGIADTSVLVTQTQLTNAVSGAAVDQSALAGTGLAWDGVAEQFTIDSTVATKAYADQAEADAITAAATDATTKSATAKSEALVAAANDATTKVDAEATARTTAISTAISNLSTTVNSALDLKASLESPVLTGNPTAPTQTVGNDSTRVATTAFVKAAIQDISSLDLVLDGGGV